MLGHLLRELAEVLAGHRGARPELGIVAAGAEFDGSEVRFEIECITWVLAGRLGLKIATRRSLRGHLKDGGLMPPVSRDRLLHTVIAIERHFGGALAFGETVWDCPRRPHNWRSEDSVALRPTRAYAESMTTTGPRRVCVLGSSGAGKTTVATRVARILSVPRIELDELHWGENWTPADTATFTARVDEAISAESWVIDGNYQSKLGTRILDRADTIVWVDPGRPRIMYQVITRTIRRAWTRQVLWNGNTETWSAFKIWRREDSIIWWAWHSSGQARTKFGAIMGDPAFSHAQRRRLRTRSEISDFLEDLSAKNRST